MALFFRREARRLCKLGRYGVATVSRIDTIIGLLCRISSLLLGTFAKETYNFIDPTRRSHPIDLLKR